ncbi:sugar-binding protein [Pseudomonas syringae]|nr:sugar-binding protein [Pseudomonas syringae]
MSFKLYINIIFLVAASDAAADEYQWTFKNINFFPSAEAACRDTVLRQLESSTTIVEENTISIANIYYPVNYSVKAVAGCRFSFRMKPDLSVLYSTENYTVFRVGDGCANGLEYNPTTGTCSVDKMQGLPAKNDCVGNPISPASGNKFEYEKDYVHSSGLAFGRFYNSLDGSWRHSYSAHLNITSESEYVSFVSADGKAIFYKLSEGVYVDDSGNGSLVRLEAGWEYRSPANTVYQFDLAGRLTSVTEAGSIQYTLAYAGREVKVIALNGQVLTFTEDARHQPLSFSSEGVIINYKYDANLHLTEVERIQNGVTARRHYHYEDPRNTGLLTGITDERGVLFATWSYDEKGRAVSSQHSDGAGLTQVAYNTDGSSTVTNELGKTTIYHYQQIGGIKRVISVEGEPSANCPASNSTYTYDERGLMLTKTYAKGLVTTYTYDDRGLEVSRTEASGTPVARTITTEWDPARFLPVKTVDDQRITSYRYDDQGREISRQSVAR